MKFPAINKKDTAEEFPTISIIGLTFKFISKIKMSNYLKQHNYTPETFL